MGTLIDYWYYTGDDSWNDDTMEGLLFQVGDKADYMPRNQTKTEGNDDQGFWGLAAMTAAEYKFPDPPDDKPQWLALAQAVFNTQAARWDTEHCGGGLRWQIFTWNNGYDYKNTISGACFFSLGARLALYTGNETYADWATKTWDWTESVGYIDDKWNVYDGAHIDDNCTELTKEQWSYNIGGYMLGAAAMYNHTEDDAWKDRLDGMLKGIEFFFKGDENDIMTEVQCESTGSCNTDQQSFKAYFSRWLANVVTWYPESAETIMPLLRSSSKAAAKQCTGGDNGRMCGLKWTDNGKWDGSVGLGQQMAALEASIANLVPGAQAPVTEDTGGTSKGDSNAGGSDDDRDDDKPKPITAGDRAGAGILTALVLGSLIAAIAFMLSDDVKDAKGAGSITGALGYYPAASRFKDMDGGGGDLGRGLMEKGASGSGAGVLSPAGGGGVGSPRTPASPGNWLDSAAVSGSAAASGSGSGGEGGRGTASPANPFADSAGAERGGGRGHSVDEEIWAPSPRMRLSDSR